MWKVGECRQDRSEGTQGNFWTLVALVEWIRLTKIHNFHIIKIIYKHFKNKPTAPLVGAKGI